jgi:molybdopterin-guanine dinucleotide biosynthesis protein A
MGPYGGILSAFMSDPEAAWLVVACDLPLIDASSINQLIEQRNPSRYATAFQSPKNEFPEPLITIWEPKSYMRLLEFMALGYSCPRKVLINSDVELLQAKDPMTLMNVNTPEDLEQVKSILLERS